MIEVLQEGNKAIQEGNKDRKDIKNQNEDINKQAANIVKQIKEMFQNQGEYQTSEILNKLNDLKIENQTARTALELHLTKISKSIFYKVILRIQLNIYFFLDGTITKDMLKDITTAIETISEKK